MNLILRIDLNSPIKDGKIIIGNRFKTHLETIKNFQKRGVKLIILAHQGRVKKPDFINLKQHNEWLNNYSKNEIKFVEGFEKETIRKEIKNLKNEETLLLDNVRMLKNSDWLIKELSEWYDLFVLDALSVSHRESWDVMGFKKIKAGPVLLKELNAVNKILKPTRPLNLILGGVKIEEPLQLIKSNYLKPEQIFLGGLLGEAFLMKKGFEIGDLKKEKIKSIIEMNDFKHFFKNFKNINLPKDFLLKNGRSVKLSEVKEDDKVFGIGFETINDWLKKLNNNNSTNVFKGPLEWFEKTGGVLTKKLVNETKGYKFIAGGHLSEVVKEINGGYVSLSGGAVLKLLSGEKLPVLEKIHNLKTLKRPCH